MSNNNIIYISVILSFGLPLGFYMNNRTKKMEDSPILRFGQFLEWLDFAQWLDIRMDETKRSIHIFLPDPARKHSEIENETIRIDFANDPKGFAEKVIVNLNENKVAVNIKKNNKTPPVGIKKGW